MTNMMCVFTQREKYYGDRTHSQLVKFALEHVRSEVVELWSGNFKSRVSEDDDPATRNLPWLISFCTTTHGTSSYLLLLQHCAQLAISSSQSLTAFCFSKSFWCLGSICFISGPTSVCICERKLRTYTCVFVTKTVLVSQYGNQNFHLMFLNQNGSQFILHYMRRFTVTLSAQACGQDMIFGA